MYYVLDNITWNPSKGSTILRLYNDDIRKKVFYAPDLMCQRVIADTLKTIDKKITLNRQINDNLRASRAQSQTQFELCRGAAVNADVSPNLPTLDRSLGGVRARRAA